MGNYGSNTMEYLRTARKPHACYWCGRDIRPGQKYWDYTPRHKECLSCGPEE
jgi:hypothetical protein